MARHRPPAVLARIPGFEIPEGTAPWKRNAPLDELAVGIALLLVIALLVVAADAEMLRTQAPVPAPVRPTPQQRLKQLATKLQRTLRTTRALPAPVA